MFSSNASDVVINRSPAPALQDAKEAGKGYISGGLAGMVPAGPLPRALVTAIAKLSLDYLDDWLSGPQDKLADAPVDGPHQQ